MTREKIKGLRLALSAVAPDLVMGDLEQFFDFSLSLMDAVDGLEAQVQALKEEKLKIEVDLRSCKDAMENPMYLEGETQG